MIQIVYISTSRTYIAGSRAGILEESRRNNRRDGISGLLFDDGVRFLQVLEGPEDRVEAAVQRIKADARHRAIVILSRRSITAREFGDWAMASFGEGHDAEAVIVQVDALVSTASPNVQATFQSFTRYRAAA